MEFSNILVRAANWVGDAVMSLPALHLLRVRFPSARISVVAKPWVADIYARESFATELIPYRAKTLAEKFQFARGLRGRGFDAAILLQNAFEAAALAVVAGIPTRIGYNRDGRGWLLTERVAVPKKGEIARHERFYYLEMLRRAGIVDELPLSEGIRLGCASDARQAGKRRFAELGIGGPVIGLGPGAAYGTAKQWLPERFAEAAVLIARIRGAEVALFGTAAERALCEEIGRRIEGDGVKAHNFAGETTLGEFIDLAAACGVFLTNDSGPMHIASALGVPTVAVFGATDPDATGPTGEKARVVREAVRCSPCLLRNCPIDHRCMTGVTGARVAETALDLFQ